MKISNGLAPLKATGLGALIDVMMYMNKDGVNIYRLGNYISHQQKDEKKLTFCLTATAGYHKSDTGCHEKS